MLGVSCEQNSFLLDSHTLRHLVQLSQQFGRDGEGVTACQGEDLPCVAEACAHHDGVVPVFLVVVVDLSDGQHPGVLLGLVRLVVFRLKTWNTIFLII